MKTFKNLNIKEKIWLYDPKANDIYEAEVTGLVFFRKMEISVFCESLRKLTNKRRLFGFSSIPTIGKLSTLVSFDSGHMVVGFFDDTNNTIEFEIPLLKQRFTLSTDLESLKKLRKQNTSIEVSDLVREMENNTNKIIKISRNVNDLSKAVSILEKCVRIIEQRKQYHIKNQEQNGD